MVGIVSAPNAIIKPHIKTAFLAKMNAVQIVIQNYYAKDQIITKYF